MSHITIDVLASGAVCLGERVVCDDFIDGNRFRLQTHLHDDHIMEFDRSKGIQQLFLSPETFALLVAERNFDIEHRTNLHRIDRGTPRYLDDGSTLKLLRSDHMLGACQVSLVFPGGRRVGYSGDFSWPLREVIEVDELVVDSAYGSPDSIGHYAHDEAKQCLISLICERWRHGSVHVNAYRGTIERVLHVLGGNVGVPILASPGLIREVHVYQQYGFAAEGLVSMDSDEGRAAVRDRAYIRLYPKGDGFGNERVEGTCVTISAYMAESRHPLVTYPDRAYEVALSNHADFNGTLEFVRATGAGRVVTDNPGNNGLRLAFALRDRLGVEAEPSSDRVGPNWR